MDKSEFLHIIQSTPLVSIDLIVKSQQGHYLLGMRNNRPAQGYWFVPGGRIRKNETLATAFKRIAQVELGLDLDIHHATLQGAYDHLYADNYLDVDGIDTHYVVLAYEILIDDESIIQPDEQHSEIKWWAKADLLEASTVHENSKNYFRNT